MSTFACICFGHDKPSHSEGKMATKHEVSKGFKKALTERTSGTGTMEEMMAGEAAVIASTPHTVFVYWQCGAADNSPDFNGDSGAERVFHETEACGSRPVLGEMIAILRAGDRVVVHSIDGLARDMRDLQDIVRQINTKGASISFQVENLTFEADHSDPIVAMQSRMLEAFSSFERALTGKGRALGPVQD
ncbi:recombinase family protein [Paracoccaceae bacterium]|nr:recombinase family protein [Paracoccaceae bacterium]